MIRKLLLVASTGVVLVLAGCTPAAPGASTTPTSAAAAERAVTGSFFYLAAGAGGSAELWQWTPAGPPRQRFSLDKRPAQASLSVSPDGRRLSWAAAGTEGDAGPLYVADVDGTGRHTVDDGVDPACAEPVWTPDGRRLLVTSGGDPESLRTGTVDVATGTYQEWAHPAPPGCHPRWSADGRTVAWADGHGGLVLTAADGADRRKVPGVGPGTKQQAFDPVSLSRDGRYLAVWLTSAGADAGDVPRGLAVNAVLDTATGTAVTLPVPGPVREAVFEAGGDLVVRSGTPGQVRLTLLSPGLTVEAGVAEPPALEGMRLLAATP